MRNVSLAMNCSGVGSGWNRWYTHYRPPNSPRGKQFARGDTATYIPRTGTYVALRERRYGRSQALADGANWRDSVGYRGVVVAGCSEPVVRKACNNICNKKC